MTKESKSFWDSMAVKGEEVEDRMAVQGESVKDRMSVPAESELENPMTSHGVKRFSWTPDYKGKDGKGSLESTMNNTDMYRAGNETNRG